MDEHYIVVAILYHSGLNDRETMTHVQCNGAFFFQVFLIYCCLHLRYRTYRQGKPPEHHSSENAPSTMFGRTPIF